jgi:hypothetical protein
MMPSWSTGPSWLDIVEAFAELAKPDERRDVQSSPTLFLGPNLYREAIRRGHPPESLVEVPHVAAG